MLGNSHAVAKRRFHALERKLIATPNLRLAYNDVINEYIVKGYLSEIPYTSATANEGYFIPHHAVVRPDKATTKFRVVLDASTKTDKGVSLNDLLHIGPYLQADLFTLLLHFRLFAIALTADIKQMYLRILVSEEHRKFQKILFRFNEHEPIRIFQFNSVAFGLRSSPYLAMRTVRQLTADEGDRFPRAAQVAIKQLYMDDLTTSVKSTEAAINLSQELRSMFESAGFELLDTWSSGLVIRMIYFRSYRNHIVLRRNSLTTIA